MLTEADAARHEEGFTRKKGRPLDVNLPGGPPAGPDRAGSVGSPGRPPAPSCSASAGSANRATPCSPLSRAASLRLRPAVAGTPYEPPQSGIARLGGDGPSSAEVPG